jgi:hypothetical protein
MDSTVQGRLEILILRLLESRASLSQKVWLDLVIMVVCEREGERG